jgi:hypothetical protein
MAYLSCMVVEGLKNGFPKQDVNMSLVLSLVREISVLFDTGDAVNAVGMCSLEWRIAQASLKYLSDGAREKICE